jgi:hypothetical protein
MREIRTSSLMSGDGRRGEAGWLSYRAHPRLYCSRFRQGWPSGESQGLVYQNFIYLSAPYRLWRKDPLTHQEA